jgi:hypothetical protein
MVQGALRLSKTRMIAAFLSLEAQSLKEHRGCT